MGGTGSTRWAGHARRPVVEDYAPIRIRDFADALHEARARWEQAGRPRRSAWLPSPPDARAAWQLGPPAPAATRRPAVVEEPAGTTKRQRGSRELHALGWFQFTRAPETGRRVAVGAPGVVLSVEAVPAPLGGVRWWWGCPGCRRRCAALYAPLLRRGSPDVARARCRRCYGLAYGCQRLAPEARLTQRARRLAGRLRVPYACVFDPLEDEVSRPRGMWRSRFAREAAKLEAVQQRLDDVWLDRFVRTVGGLIDRFERQGFRFPGWQDRTGAPPAR